MNITVSHERLETTGNFCNVKFGVSAPFTIHGDEATESEYAAAFAIVQKVVDDQIADAKRRKQEEIERQFRTQQVFGDPDEPLGGEAS